MASILDVMTDRALLGSVFGDASWAPWRAFAASVYGLPLDPEGLALYRQATGRTAPPTEPAREAFALCGRRSGKSIVAALLGVYAAAFRTYRLSPGETPVVLIAAVDKRQAGVILDYCRGLLDACVLTRSEVAATTGETLTLRSGVRIEVRSSNYRSVRGVTLAAAVIDEACFLRDEDSTSPDVEVYRALKPALLTTRGLLVAISSPWAQRGLMYERWKRHHGRDGDPVLTWVAPSAVMNPTLDPAAIAEALADDPTAARTEWEARWREDITPFLSEDQVAAVVVPNRRELPPQPGVRYVGFLDPSGGSQDSFTAAVAHREERDGGTVVVLDALLERVPPFDPERVVAEVAALLAAYGVTVATSDRYAGVWVPAAFLKHGIRVEQSAAAKSELYASALPLILGRRCELLDLPRLQAQFVALERKTARSGRESIAEPPGGHDDLANGAVGAVVLATQAAGSGACVFGVRDAPVPVEDREAIGDTGLGFCGARWRREVC
ncbi:MAG: hypothetical protein U0807_16200 [Candidatus Binatia bacterium]